MKTKLLVTVGFFLGAIMLHAQNKEISVSDSDEITGSPMMMLGRGKEAAQKGEDVSNRKLTAEELSAQERRRYKAVQQEERLSETDGVASVKQLWSNSFQGAEEVKPPASAEEIFARRYLQLDVREFEMIAGPKSNYSPEYSAIIQEIESYHRTQNLEEKSDQLQELQKLVEKYRKKKEGMRETAVNQHKMTEKEIAEVERAHRRIDACNLLERGMIVEQCRLEERSMPYLDPEHGLLPKKGIRFRPEEVLEFKSNFASGMMSSVARLRHVSYGEKDFIFKEESPLEELTYDQARQLGFSEERKKRGITKKEANLSGRSLATYKINELLGSHLVPQVRYAALGSEGRAKIGHVQDMVKGVELLKKGDPMEVSQEELHVVKEKYDLEDCLTWLVDAALGKCRANIGYAPPDYLALKPDWQLVFPSSLTQVSIEKPLLENGELIKEERALALAEQGAFSFQKKELVSVDDTIDFEDPLLQKTMASAQLLHLITGELDPNPGNFIYVKILDEGWHVAIIDSDLSFSARFVFSEKDLEEETPEALEQRLNQSLEKVAMDLQAAVILQKMPLLIDEGMGEAVLALTEEEVETTLKETGLTREEIEATKNRFKAVQQYVQVIKNKNALVKDAQGEDSISFDQQSSLVWGENTYRLAKANPQSTYLGRTLEDQAVARKQLQALLTQKIKELEEKSPLTDIQEQKLSDLKKQLKQREHPQEPKRVETRRSSSHQARRLSHAGSVGTVLSKKSASTIASFVRAFKDLRYQHRHWNPELSQHSLSWLSALRGELSSEEEARGQYIRVSNEALIKARHQETLALDALAGAQEKTLLLTAAVEEVTTLWRRTVDQLKKEEDAWHVLLTAYQEEQGAFMEQFSTERQNALKKAEDKKAVASLQFLWAHVYQAESAAEAVFKKVTVTSNPTSWNKFFDHVGSSQQAWSSLLFKITSPWNDQEVWKKNLAFAERVKRHTKFFPYWVNVTKKHIESILSPSLAAVYYEGQPWDLLIEKEKQLMMHPEIAGDGEKRSRSLLQELEFQKNYSLAQTTTYLIENLQKKISELINKGLIGGEHQGTNNYVINRVSEEKVKELCERWGELQFVVHQNAKAWDQGINALRRFSTTNGSHFHHLREHYKTNPSFLLAWLRSGLQEAQDLSYLGEASDQLAREQPSLESLSQARTLCENLLRDYDKYKLIMWKPSFPTVELYETRAEYTGEVTFGGGALDIRRHQHLIYTRHNHRQEKPIQIFLNNLNQFPACLPLKDALKEIIDGYPDLIAEKWQVTLQELREVQGQVARLLQLALQEKNTSIVMLHHEEAS